MPHNGPSQSDYLMMRYAHPFFTTIPPENRQPIEELNASRMAEFIAQNLGPIPKPKRTSAMKLAEVIGEAGVQEIEAAGSISFHATGDTGQQNGALPIRRNRWRTRWRRITAPATAVRIQRSCSISVT